MNKLYFFLSDHIETCVTDEHFETCRRMILDRVSDSTMRSYLFAKVERKEREREQLSRHAEADEIIYYVLKTVE